MSAALYINSKGYAVTRHSYSASLDFNNCAKYYELKRIVGWAEKEKKAAMEFGTCVELGHRAYHIDGLSGALKMFSEEWDKRKEMPLTYSEKNGDWSTLRKTGMEFLQLYDILYPTLPFEIEDFQVESHNEIFPDTDLAGLELVSYIDLIVKMKQGVLDPAVEAVSTKGIFDMKVSGSSCPILVSLDPQLRTYSWVKGIPTVGFLWFEIQSRKMNRGDEVTYIGGKEIYKPGQKLFILSEDFNVIPHTPPSMYFTDDILILDTLNGMPNRKNDEKTARQEFITKNGVIVPIHNTTRQEIKVSFGTVSDESRQDIKKQVEQDIIRIVQAHEDQYYPMQSGIRFPNDKCPSCCMRGICSGNSKLRDELIERKMEDLF